MRKREMILKILLLIAFTFYSGVMVAYAAMSKNLSINYGHIIQNALSWNINFSANTFTPIVIGTSNVGLSCADAALTKSGTLTISDITLSKPGDECNYKIGIVNEGDIKAILSAIGSVVSPIYCDYVQNTCQQCDFNTSNPGGPYVCGKITYLFTETSNGTTGIPVNSLIWDFNPIQNLNRRYIYLRVFYNADTVSGGSYSLSDVSFKFTFTQY